MSWYFDEIHRVMENLEIHIRVDKPRMIKYTN